MLDLEHHLPAAPFEMGSRPLAEVRVVLAHDAGEFTTYFTYLLLTYLLTYLLAN